MKKFKKAFIIIAAVLGALILLAVVVGVISGLTGAGWNFGWTDYRYDDIGYSVGSGTVYADGISTIDINWIDGRVEVIACQDSYISITESCDTDLNEDSLVHWCVSEDGSRLSVKYRASSWYWGMTDNRNKKLIVRVPQRLFDGLLKVAIEGNSADISVKGIQSDAINLESGSGKVMTENCIADTADLKTVSGNITYNGAVLKELKTETGNGNIALIFAEDSSFVLQYTTAGGGEPRIAFPHRKEGETYLCGGGERSFTVYSKTKNGELKIEY